LPIFDIRYTVCTWQVVVNSIRQAISRSALHSYHVFASTGVLISHSAEPDEAQISRDKVIMST